MRIAMLLGSGASVPAGMPSVGAITERVLSGDRVLRHGSDFRLVAALPPNHDAFTAGVVEVVEFVGELKQLCDDYFRSQDKDRTTNYEDIAYVAGQIKDGLLSEYENPALLPLNERLSRSRGRGRHELAELAGASVDYIEDVVCGLLEGATGPLDHLNALIDAFGDTTVEHLTLATLNHDLVLEHGLQGAGAPCSDGFEELFGTLRVWNDAFRLPHRRLLKLHGSIDWWRYDLRRDGWSGQVIARATDGDPFHARGPDGELLEVPVGPQILTGTFNKILSYPSGVYADQHFRFHEALATAEALVVIGYGFRDKAINARVVAWAERPGRRRMVVLHADPIRLGAGARGAIRDKWTRWQQSGLLQFVSEQLSPTTTWSSISHLLN